mgnify:CR=1 FL=1
MRRHLKRCVRGGLHAWPRHGDLLRLEGLRPVVFPGHPCRVAPCWRAREHDVPRTRAHGVLGKCRCSSHPDFADRARCPLRCERGIQRALPQQGPLRAGSTREDDRVRNAPCPARFRGEDGGSTPTPAQEEIGTRTRRLSPVRRRKRESILLWIPAEILIRLRCRGILSGWS